MIMISHTNAQNDYAQYALLELNAETAAALLAHRELVELVIARTASDDFYSIELWDYRVIYTNQAAMEEKEDEQGQLEDWLIGTGVHTRAEIVADAVRIEVSAIHLTESGVYWSAYPKHGDNKFETPVLFWAELQAIVDGREEQMFNSVTFTKQR